MDATRQQLLDGLRTKYLALHALRVQAEAATPEGVRSQLAALSQRFPGALRELDRLPLESIAARLAAIEQQLASGAAPASWMRLQLGYHGFMRATLRIRSGLRARAAPLDDAQAALLAIAYEPAADEPPATRFDLAALQFICKPVSGRLNPWVFAQVARDHGVSPQAVHDALFDVRR